MKIVIEIDCDNIETLERSGTGHPCDGINDWMSEISDRVIELHNRCGIGEYSHIMAPNINGRTAFTMNVKGEEDD